MVDYTEMFNKARVKLGRELTVHTVTIAFEGMMTGCGCPVTNTVGFTFTITHHGESCKYHRDGKQRVGDGIRNAIASVYGQPNTLAMTKPWCGLFPHEEVAHCRTLDNARLIAAAPQLLAALANVVAQFEGIDDSKWPTQGMRVAVEQARTAIARVMGDDL
jgi:hypothetical protein